MRRVLLVAVLALSIACGRAQAPTELPGTYRQDFGFGVDTLTLESGGTFREEFRYTSGATLSSSGSWTSVTQSGETLVELDGAFIRPDFRGPERLNWFLEAELGSGRTVLKMTPTPDAEVMLVRIQ
jgi:hypothetical protein